MPRKTLNPGNILLVIDAGNTATNFALFKLSPWKPKPRPIKTWTISTAQIKNKSLLRSTLHKNIRRQPLAGTIVSSVVPTIDSSLSASIKTFSKLSPVFVTGRTQSRIKVRYRNPSEVGADRIVNARAAMAYGRGPAIVVDFGTATTFDCVSGRWEYLGGVIAPGPMISAEALYQRTAKLPKVLLAHSAQILGRTTMESIESGLYHGYRGLVKEIVLKLKKKLGPGTKVFSTGGQARWVLKGVESIDENIPHLTLIGLYHVWHDLHSKNQSIRRKLR